MKKKKIINFFTYFFTFLYALMILLKKRYQQVFSNSQWNKAKQINTGLKKFISNKTWKKKKKKKNL
jgi:hypothetical protein